MKRNDVSPAFVMATDDRFDRIIVSDPVQYDVQPDAETILAFFVIHRAAGTFDIVNVMKTFDKGELASRNVQAKPGISPSAIADAVDNVLIDFALRIERLTGYKLKWHALDLSGVADRDEQVERIRAWGKLGLWRDVPLGS